MTTSLHSPTLSLEQACGQMLMLGFRGDVYPHGSDLDIAIQNNALGGIILFDVNVKTRGPRNITSSKQIQTLNQTLQETALRHSQLPLLCAVDYEGGYVNRLPESLGFPKTITAEAFAALPLDEAHAAACALANTVAQAGFNIDFAPVVDVNSNKTNPIIGGKKRSFSTDPVVVAQMAAIQIRAFRESGILSCAKHFPGHGSSRGDSHEGCVDITDTWQTNELIPYRQTEADMVMIGHLVNRQLDESGLPASLSHKMVHRLLREELSFNGIIVTDDIQMQALTDHYSLKDILTLTVNAGCDLIIIAQQLGDDIPYATLIRSLVELVNEGKIDSDTIYRAANRILGCKQRLKTHQQAQKI